MGGWFEAVLGRDRLVVAAALAVLTALAWTYLLQLATSMSMPAASGSMAGMKMAGMAETLSPTMKAWSLPEFLLTFIMWSVMMVGMMVPSASPMILLYTRVARSARDGKPFASSAWFAGGYLLSWIGFALIATIAQWALERAALLSVTMASSSKTFGGIVLIAAGLYQWTPLKSACLSQCQSPLQFIQRHGGFRRGGLDALRLGLTHGAYCIGCCWALMALLFVGGVMNVLWIAALAIFVLAEKVLGTGRVLSRVAGVAFILAGALVLF
jgi:predicted metal-binding membrane protein